MNGNPDALAERLAEVFTQAQHRYRTQRRVYGALCTPLVPAELIEAVAADLAPVFRMAAAEAAREVMVR